MLYAVILAGGRGERFWPLSRSESPKQLLRLTSEKTMLEETLSRLEGFIPLERTLIVAGEELKERILSSMGFLKEDNLLAEPRGRNTCLAIGLAAVHIGKQDPGAILVVLSSDHQISPSQRLVEILQAAADHAEREDCLFTIGVVPTRAETAYGYIELQEMVTAGAVIPIYRVKKFKEKPSKLAAQEYYYDRKHLWNSGIFVWSVKALLAAMRTAMPELASALERYQEEIGTAQELQVRRELYQGAPDISVDCAILEKAKNVLTIKADIHWDDVGSWLALSRIKKLDRENNVIIGEALALDTYETTILNDGQGLVATHGVSDLVVVKTADVVLVAHKTRIPDIKELVAQLGKDEKLRRFL
jgi:mannose-1-phosphate guanylyltransferase